MEAAATSLRYLGRSSKMLKISRRALIGSLAATAVPLRAAPRGGLAVGTPLATLQQQYINRKLGMFVHFNMSTFVGVQWADPATAVNTFNPTALNIDSWISAAKAMGAKYIILTAKHHDGFCLWPTATTVHCITSTSWYAANPIDILGQFLIKTRIAGLIPIVYTSIWDRNFELNNPTFTQAQYKAFLQAQMTELLTNYGPFAGLWLDGGEWHFGSAFPWDSAAQRNAFVHSFQNSQCLVIDNSHNKIPVESDIVVYEDPVSGIPNPDVPNGNTAASELATSILNPNTDWFWISGDTTMPAATLAAQFTQTIANNASMVLNVPPDTTGAIPSNIAAAAAAFGAAI